MKKRISFSALLLAILMLCCGCSTIQIPIASQADTLSPLPMDTDVVGRVPTVGDTGAPVFVWYGEGDGIRVKQMLLSEFSPENLLRALEKQGVVPASVAVNSCSLSYSGNMLRLDLTAPFQTALDAASSLGKMVMLRCVVNTFASALGAESVRLTVEGESPLDGGRPYAQPMAMRSGDSVMEILPLYDAALAKRVAITFDDGPHAT